MAPPGVLSTPHGPRDVARETNDNFVTSQSNSRRGSTRVMTVRTQREMKDLIDPLTKGEDQCQKSSGENTGRRIPTKVNTYKTRNGSKPSTKSWAGHVSLTAMCSNNEQNREEKEQGQLERCKLPPGSPCYLLDPPPTNAKTEKKDRKRRKIARSASRQPTTASSAVIGGNDKEEDITINRSHMGVMPHVLGESVQGTVRYNRLVTPQGSERSQPSAGLVVAGRKEPRGLGKRVEPIRMRDLGSDTPENLRGQRKRKAIRHDLVGSNDGTYRSNKLQGLSGSSTEDIGKGKAINPQEEHRSRVDQPGEKLGSIGNKEIGLPEARMEQETTKVVREVTMPMTASQKQNALHKGTQGSNKNHPSEEKPKESIKRKKEMPMKNGFPI